MHHKHILSLSLVVGTIVIVLVTFRVASDTKVGTPEEVRVDVQREALHREQLDYVARLDTEVQNLERQIDDLETNARAARIDQRADYESALNDVRARRDALKADVASIGAATDTSWDPLKTRIDVDLQDLQRSVRTASSRLQGVPRQSR
jgi:hypothetical protein